jgi:hypothetical protein
MIWESIFVVIGMSFECATDSFLLQDLNYYRLKAVGCMRLKVEEHGCSRLKHSRLRAGSRLGGRGNPEALIVLIPPLVLNVGLDRLLIHCAHRRAKVPARPQMLAPVALP